MAIRVHTFDADENAAQVVHDYERGYSVKVQPDGTLLVATKGTGAADSRAIGAYPPGKWTAAYDEKEMVAQADNE
ncbi:MULTISPECIES: hypothetical protein [Rhodococcus]|uniref:hypothetical protein n=1 Tax=Rhodococcus TaxID=1827 RepID=UPI00193BFF22|nr:MULTISPECIES: hypothetical protein [Rhodococcus]QRI74703.1 hypothetical protein JQ505_19245 [Rhodococcus aetherivorans]QSE58114.1 hypothetical protein JYA75_20355 [Rhodococcus sp. PSBB066]